MSYYDTAFFPPASWFTLYLLLKFFFAEGYMYIQNIENQFTCGGFLIDVSESFVFACPLLLLSTEPSGQLQ